MNFYVLTLFPEMITGAVNTSITGRAIKKGLISVDAVNIRDFADNSYGQIDDYPYGGGAGMVMQPGPVYRAHESVMEKIRAAAADGSKSRGQSEGQSADGSESRGQSEGQAAKPKVIYLTPQGETFSQKKAVALSKESDIILLCGHYEGVDERVIEEIGAEGISIGDYVLTGGELAALVVIDAVSRLVPGVLGNSGSKETETFSGNLLEYPQYTRPEVFNGRAVPEVLLSGHHENVEKWRRQQSLLRTMQNRPDLLRDADLSKDEADFLRKNGLKN